MATIRLRRGTTGPTGLTLGEPAFDYSNNRLFVGVTASSVWVGGEVDNNTSLGTSQVKIPTQFAVKTYVDNNVAGGAVSSLNGLTGAVTIQEGNGILVGQAGAKGILLTNSGVHSLTLTQGSGISITGSGTTGALSYTIANAGVTGIQAGTGISVSSSTGNITLTNTGVQSAVGTANQITVTPSGGTGALTLSLPSSITTPGNLNVTGNLTVNGTTTYVNSTVTEIVDPIITLGWTGGIGGMPIDDDKDRGIAFKYNSSGGRTGFFGYDDSTGYFTFVPVAGITAEVVGGSVGTAQFAGVISQGSTLTLSSSAAIGSPATITLTGSALEGSEIITASAGTFTINTPSLLGQPASIRIDDGSDAFAILQPTAFMGTNNTITLPNHTGTVVAPANLGITSGHILRSNGITAQPTWIDANAAGFTAFAAQEIVGGAAGNLLYQSSANNTAFVTNAGITGSVLTYNTTSNTPVFINPNIAGFTANAATNIGGGAAGSLPYNTAATTTTFLSIGTSGFVLTSTGSAPQWSNLTGLTAGTAQTVTVSSSTDSTSFLTFIDTASNSNQNIRYNSNLAYNASTNYLEVNIDGGAY